MFVARLERIDGEYVVTVPHEVIVQQDFREGQTVSVAVESLSDYVSIDATTGEPGEVSWKLNEDGPAYLPDTNPASE